MAIFPYKPATFAVVSLSLLFAPPMAPASPENGSRFVGTGSCAASNCHGSVTGRQVSNVLQNEYVTWSKHDAHSRAWRVLTESRSDKMAQHLGLRSAREAPECISCHAPSSGTEKKWDEDGVGCESCHGGASGWLKSHVEKGATHEQNVQNGLRDLANLSKRAQVCSSCHIGDSSRWVTHRMYGAGHPRLSFELDTFTTIMPAHWVLDDDYVQRKGAYDSVKAFLIGQTQAATRSLESLRHALADSKRLLPEFTVFSCFSCHRGIRSSEWQVSEYRGFPGEPRLQTAPLLILEEVFASVDPSLSDSLRGAREAMEQSFHETGSIDGLDALLKLLTGRASAPAHAWQGDDRSKRELGARLLRLVDGGAVVSFELAEQLTMGSGAIISGLGKRDARLEKGLQALYTALADPERYHSKAFREAALRLAQTFRD